MNDVSDFKQLLKDTDNYDRFQILDKLHTFSIHHVDEECTPILRQHLQKAILEEILKVESGEVYHSRMMKVVMDLKTTDPAYKCCLIGCRFTHRRHREYLRHLKAEHSNLSKLVCNFGKKCLRSFDNIMNLIDHVKEMHMNGSSEKNAEKEIASANQVKIGKPVLILK